MTSTEESSMERTKKELQKKLAEAQAHPEKFTEDQLDQLAMDCRAFKLI